MKKKFLAFLLVLASIIACTVCLAACDNGGVSRDEYVGKYEFISLHVVMEMDGERTVVDDVAGVGNVTKDFYTLELKSDGSYIMSINNGMTSMQGTWTVKGGKLGISSKDGSSGSYQNAVLSDGVLTMSSRMELEGIGWQEQELKLKKVA